VNRELTDIFQSIPDTFFVWLDQQRNKNPLKGSDGAKNTNSVFVEIGKNNMVDYLLDLHTQAHTPTKTPDVKFGSELLGGIKPA
jgi:hypothetical protein